MTVFYAVEICTVMADDGREVNTRGAGRGSDNSMPVPSKWWYVGHLFFWVITGLVVYILYKDTNREAARKHLIVSLVLGIVVFVALVGLLLAVEVATCGGDLECYAYDDEW